MGQRVFAMAALARADALMVKKVKKVTLLQPASFPASM